MLPWPLAMEHLAKELMDRIINHTLLEHTQFHYSELYMKIPQDLDGIPSYTCLVQLSGLVALIVIRSHGCLTVLFVILSA